MTIPKKVFSFLNQTGFLSEDAKRRETSHDLKLAVAVVVVRSAYCDKRFAEEERTEILKDLSHEFSLEERDVEELIEEAREFQEYDSWIASFIDRIRESFTVDQRIEVLSLVWRVVESDDFIDSEEQDFINQLEERLGLTAKEGAEAKRRSEIIINDVDLLT